MVPEVAAALRAELLGDEGKVLRAYDDQTGRILIPGTMLKGTPTVGIGRNLIARGISDSECETLFANDCVALEVDLARLTWIRGLSPKRQMVVYSLYFNVSLGSPRHFIATWPNFLSQMKAGLFTAAAQNLRTTEPWATQVGERANRLAECVQYG